MLRRSFLKMTAGSVLGVHAIKFQDQPRDRKPPEENRFVGDIPNGMSYQYQIGFGGEVKSVLFTYAGVSSVTGLGVWKSDPFKFSDDELPGTYVAELTYELDEDNLPHNIRVTIPELPV